MVRIASDEAICRLWLAKSRVPRQCARAPLSDSMDPMSRWLVGSFIDMTLAWNIIRRATDRRLAIRPLNGSSWPPARLSVILAAIASLPIQAGIDVITCYLSECDMPYRSDAVPAFVIQPNWSCQREESVMPAIRCRMSTTLSSARGAKTGCGTRAATSMSTPCSDRVRCSSGPRSPVAIGPRRADLGGHGIKVAGFTGQPR